MVIVRYEPGDFVPEDGCYSLVGHYGEPTGALAWCWQGERFPAAPQSDGVIPPMLFVRLFSEEESARRLHAPHLERGVARR